MSNQSKAPVSTRVENGVVILSKSREATLAKIKNAEARSQLRSEWVAEALAFHEKNQVFIARRSQYGLKLSDDKKILFVNGTGTRMGAGFTKAQALVFLADIENFKNTVNSMPE